MPLKLRDLIRNVRACRTLAEERAVIAKECADIRTSFRNKDDEPLRHRNVAKLLYIHLLGYPTHFGQMEAMKLLATSRFAEKRIGYLALMLLLDENAELLMLATNCMKRDLESSNPYIQGLSLSAIGNIASQAIARDLSLDIIKVMNASTNNAYIRKKAALCALRTIRRVVDLVEDYIHPAADLINDRSNSVQMCGVHLMSQIVKFAPEESVPHYRVLIPRLCALIRSTWNVSYNPEYDIMGINDPFLQVTILRFIRLLSQHTITVSRPDPETNLKSLKLITLGPIEDEHLEKINDTLAALSANIDPAKVPGAAIYYEAILTTLTVSNDQTLRVNAIIQLGKFLQSRDNNIRYISLNTMYQVAQQQLSTASASLQGVKGIQLRELKQQQQSALTNLEVIQRYRNTIVAYLKDPDPSIRKRALSLIYALVTDKNVRPLVRELLMYLALKPTVGSGEEGLPVGDATAQVETTFTNIPALVTNSLPYAGGQALPIGATVNLNSSSLAMQSSNAEFKCDLTQKIYYIIYQYAPNVIWQIHSMIMLLSTDNEFINENTFYEFVALIQNYHKLTLFTHQINTPVFTVTHPSTKQQIAITKQHIDAFIIHELFLAVNHHDRIKYPFLVQAFLFFVSQHCQYLCSPQGAQCATIVSQFLSQDSSAPQPQQQQQQQQQQGQPPPPPTLYEPNTYTAIAYDTLTSIISAVMDHQYTTEQSKQVGLTACARLLIVIRKANPSPTPQIQSSIDSLEYILSINRCHINVDLQQRASEYLTITRATQPNPQFPHKALFPVVNFTRQNLDFDDEANTNLPTHEEEKEQAPAASASSTQPQLDVFAALSAPEQHPQQNTTSQSNNPETDIFAAMNAPNQPVAQKPPAFDILNDLLQPTPQQPTPVATQTSLTTTNTSFEDLLSGNLTAPATAAAAAAAGQSPTSYDAMDLLGATSMAMTAPAPANPAPLQSNDPFGDLLSAQAQSSQNPFDILGGAMQISPKQSQPQVNTDHADLLGSFGAMAISPQSTTSNNNSFHQNNTSNNNNNNNNNNLGDDDDFESAQQDDFFSPQTPTQKSISVYNNDDINVQMIYTAHPNDPASGQITYKITAQITTTSATHDVQQFDLRIAARAPLTKSIKVPTSRSLTASSPITQELTVTNPSTSAESNTMFKCMFKCVLNGAPFDSPAFAVSL